MIEGSIRIIARTRADLEALMADEKAAHGDQIKLDAPRPARAGWRVYGTRTLAPAIGKVDAAAGTAGQERRP